MLSKETINRWLPVTICNPIFGGRFEDDRADFKNLATNFGWKMCKKCLERRRIFPDEVPTKLGFSQLSCESEFAVKISVR